MRILRITVRALAGLALLAFGGAASALTCVDDGVTFTVTPATACAPNPQNNPDNDSWPDGDPYPDSLTFQPGGLKIDWDAIDKDPGETGNPESALSYTGGTNSGTFTVDATGLSFLYYALYVKGGSNGVFFLVDMSKAVNGVVTGDWSTSGSGSGFSHMSLYGAGCCSKDVPEPGTLGLLGLGLLGLGLRRRRVLSGS